MNQNSNQSQTEIEYLQQQLRETTQAYHLVSQMSKFKAGFLARIAHEIRSPLGRIINLNQIILTGLCVDATEEKDFLHRGQTALSQLQNILDQVIAISHLANCPNYLNMQNCNLNEILDMVSHQTILQAKTNNINLNIIIPNTSIEVYADYHRLTQALTLLIDTIITWETTSQILLEVDPQQDKSLVSINLSFSGEISLFTEPINFLQEIHKSAVDISQELNISLGSKLHLITDLFESMGGMLLIADHDAQTKLITLRCLLQSAKNYQLH